MTKQTYLAIQSSYQTADIALFEDDKCLERRFYTDLKASSHLVPYIDTLLKNHNKSLSDLAFIAVDKGPGAFTTLRVTIATINGIAFAQAVPLVGIDSLKALSYEAFGSILTRKKQSPNILVALLNAYNNDVYFLVSRIENGNSIKIDYGCKKIDALLEEIALNHHNQTIAFTGNATLLHQALIFKFLEHQATIENPLTLTAGALTIGALGFADFKASRNLSNKITPNYVKTQLFAIKKTG